MYAQFCLILTRLQLLANVLLAQTCKDAPSPSLEVQTARWWTSALGDEVILILTVPTGQRGMLCYCPHACSQSVGMYYSLLAAAMLAS